MEIQNLKRRNSNTHLLSHSVSLNLKDKQLLEANQSKLDAREYICVANWRYRIIFIKNAMQEVAEKLKNSKRRCYQEVNSEKQRRLEEFRTHEQ